MLERENRQNITILEFKKGELPSPSQLENTAELFSEVFAGPPWNEVNKCPSCGLFFGNESKQGGICSSCGKGMLEKAYQAKETIKNIMELVKKPEFSLYLLMGVGEEIVGFCWGYLRSIDENVKRFNEKEKEEITRILEALLGERRFLFHAAEIGIRKDYRGRGLGNILQDKLINDASEMNSPMSVWTRKDTVAALMCLKRGFRQIYGPETIMEQNKVVSTGRFLIGIDPYVPEKVLFVDI